jgi:hypothetical protein
MNNSKSTFSYYKEEIVFGTYDIMFPQTTNSTKTEITFDCDVNLSEYISYFVNYLMDIGHSKEDIIMEFQNEISSNLRQT